MTASSAPPAEACTLVIFGAGGDLTKRLLMPAIANLANAGLLSREFKVIGLVRSPGDVDSFGASMADFVLSRLGDPAGANKGAWGQVVSSMSAISGDFNDDELYNRLKDKLKLEHANSDQTYGNVLFYLATAPSFFGLIADKLGSSGLATEDTQNPASPWRRLIVEKPFGHDLASANALNKELLQHFDEKRIYRIDHYLGKETVQNILAFRFANSMFEPIWNNRFIDQVQITVAETVGVEGRGKFYDQTGAMRDMVQNHLMQLVSMTAMEPPTSLNADAIRNEKVKVLESVPTPALGQVGDIAVRAQYASGEANGKKFVSYREEPDVDTQSRTETFAALKIHVDTWRWAGVPFYLRTGKHMAAKVSEIAVRFKYAPLQLFRHTGMEDPPSNSVVIRVQPNEGIFLRFGAKVPGPLMEIGPVEMDFAYADRFGKSNATGYETLLYDAMIGDQTLFQRADQVDAGWRIVQPILDAWAADTQSAIPTYAMGTWGPPEANKLLAEDQRRWRKIDISEYTPHDCYPPKTSE